MNPYRQLAQAMTSVVKSLTAAADAIGESGLGSPWLAAKTAATLEVLPLADRIGQANVSAVGLPQARRASNGSVRGREIAAEFDAERSRGALSSAVADVPDLHGCTFEQAESELARGGFAFKSETSGGYRRYTAGDGSEIWIRPNGEVQRLGPKISPGPNKRSYRPRYGPDGTVTQEHSTGEMVTR